MRAMPRGALGDAPEGSGVSRANLWRRIPVLHIDLPSRTEIESLAAYRGAPAVSIYLRTSAVTEHTGADRIELKNLLKEAVAQLEAGETDKRMIWPIEEAVTSMIEDDDFWTYQANSLAIFVTPERALSFRLPNALTNMAEVSDRFHLKPLLRSVTFPHHAYVLAISMGAARLIEVSANLPPRTVSVPGLPRDAASALGRRGHSEKTGAGSSGDSTSEHALMTRYARAVDQALRPVLKGQTTPLIVAAAEPMASIFRNTSTYGDVATRAIPGSADDTPDHVLATEARAVLDTVYAEKIAELGELYGAREAQGRGTMDVAQAARAATFGAIDTLLVDIDATVSGHVDETDGAVTFDDTADAANYGVIDEIARRVLHSGGRVMAVRRDDIPGKGDLAAILRYAL
jgi:hypothetical protein